MEFFILCGVFIFLFLASLFMLFQNKKKNQHLPPGKMGLAVVGETFEFLSTGWKGHPEKFIFDRLSKYAPNQVFKTSLLGEKMVVMSGPSSNKFIFSNENKLVKVWWPSSVYKIFSFSTETTSEEASRKLRTLVSTFLKPESLQRYIPTMDTVSMQQFATNWEGKDKVEVYPLLKCYTLEIACRLFLSIEDPSHITNLVNQFGYIFSGIYSIPINLPGTSFRRGIKASNFIKRELLRLVKQRKMALADGKEASFTDDILSHMLSTPDEDGRYMSEMDVAETIFGFLVGGHDTVTASCTFIVKYLAEFPQVYDAVYKEQMEIARSKEEGELLTWQDIQKMKYSWNVACEVLRLTPPLQGSFKEVINDFMYDGFRIPKGWKLYWSTQSTHRNSECFPEPGNFDPSRFQGKGPAPYTYVPFGGGPRMCPGKEFARLEILVFMHNLVKRFKWKKLIPDEKTIMSPIATPANGLPICLQPRLQTSAV